MTPTMTPTKARSEKPSNSLFMLISFYVIEELPDKMAISNVRHNHTGYLIVVNTLFFTVYAAILSGSLP